MTLAIKRISVCLAIFCLIKPILSRSIRKYDECEEFYNTSDCYYFPCLEPHYTCGPYSHLVRFSYDFCLLTRKKYASRLSSDANFYFNHTNQCAMASIHEQLIEERISAAFTCGNLQAMIFRIYIDCFQNTQRENQLVQVIDFCSIICQDLQAIIDLFLNIGDTHVNLHQLLVQTGKACGADINESVAHTVPSLLVSICLDRKNVRLKQDITQILFNERYEPHDYEWN